MKGVPYRFRDDIATADVAFDAWGGTLEAMFAAAAEALLHTLTLTPGTVVSRVELEFTGEADALDLLLLDYLQSFIFHKDARRLLLRPGPLRIEHAGGTWRLVATARGETVDPSRHEPGTDVKAVTLHRLRAAFEDGAWRATVVLDV